MQGYTPPCGGTDIIPVNFILSFLNDKIIIFHCNACLLVIIYAQ